MVQRGLAESRERAQRLIRAGKVTVAGQPAAKPGHTYPADAELALEAPERFVSRGGEKLEGAFQHFQLTVTDEICLDAGASTGGFTQVCLERGAALVHAVDVGHGQLAPLLREDPRVRVHEGLNLRSLTLAHLDGKPVDLVVGDVSFISLKLLLPAMLAVVRPTGEALLLVKPQFEVGRELLGSGGVVRDAGLRTRAVDAVAESAEELGWFERWRGVSTLPGTAGNVEYFLHLTR